MKRILYALSGLFVFFLGVVGIGTFLCTVESWPKHHLLRYPALAYGLTLGATVTITVILTLVILYGAFLIFTALADECG